MAHPAIIDTRVAAYASDLIEPARAQAFEQLGDGRRALAVAVRWLRPKLLAEDSS